MGWFRNKARAVANTGKQLPYNIANYGYQKGKQYLSSIFIIAAIFIDIGIPWIAPSTAFSGFQLDFFRSIILSGNWAGIYNIFHFNIFFLITVIAILNLRYNKPHMLRVWLTIILITYLISSYPILNTYLGARNAWEFLLLLWAAIYLSFYQVSKEDFFLASSNSDCS